jgi:DNA-binding MarR family transcriptional regulator
VLDKEVNMNNKKEVAMNILEAFSNDNCKNLTDFLNDCTRGLYVILKLIYDSKEEVVAGDLSTKLNVSTARMAVALKTLEKKKWIKKHKSTTDARKTIVELTDTGIIALQRRLDKLIEIVEKFLDKLTENETIQLLNIIQKTM